MFSHNLPAVYISNVAYKLKATAFSTKIEFLTSSASE